LLVIYKKKGVESFRKEKITLHLLIIAHL
jgi:hypothetical protein